MLGTQFCDDFSLFGTSHDVVGNLWQPFQESGNYLLNIYSRGRFYGPWNKEVMETLRTLFGNYGFLVFQQKAEFESVERTLKLKSALAFISQDFPEIAADVLYSPFMEELDRQIESWPINNPPFENFIELCDARRDKELNEVSDTHVWWNVLSKIDIINGIPYEIAEAKQRQKDRTVEEARNIDEHASRTKPRMTQLNSPYIDDQATINKLLELGRQSVQARDKLINSLKNVYSAKEAIDKIRGVKYIEGELRQAEGHLKYHEDASSLARHNVVHKEAAFDQFATEAFSSLQPITDELGV